MEAILLTAGAALLAAERAKSLNGSRVDRHKSIAENFLFPAVADNLHERAREAGCKLAA